MLNISVGTAFTRDRKADSHHPGRMVETFSINELAGVRVAFINMPLRQTAKPNTTPEGPGLMAARLRDYGAEVMLIDLNAYRIDSQGILFGGRQVLRDETTAADGLMNGRHLSESEATRLIEVYFDSFGAPDIVGLSGMITTLRWQQRIAKICRQLLPESFIVSGGGLATEIKEGLFGPGWIPELDAISHSEGDDVVMIMARDIKRAKRNQGTLAPSPDHKHCRNLEVGGRKRFVYQGDRPINLDALPFAALDLLETDPFGNRPLEWYLDTPVWGLAANNSSATSFTMKRSATSVSSRGCPFSCKFCFRGSTGERDWTVRSATNLREQAIAYKERYHIDFMGYPDDNFAVNLKRMAELPDYLGDLDLRWGTHTRMDEADERLGPMRQAGCIYIGFGAESASPAVLTAMGKGGNILTKGLTRIGGFDVPVTMVNAIRNCRDYGVHANCTWIMGYPGEKLADLQATVNFQLWQISQMTEGLTPGSVEYQAAASYVNQKMFVATAYPGTEMFRNEKVRSLLTQHFSVSFNLDGSPIPNDALLNYVLELDDATKLLHGADGRMINFGDVPDGQFMEARGYIETGQIAKILDMK